MKRLPEMSRLDRLAWSDPPPGGYPRPYQRHSETSRSAAESITDKALNDGQQRVLDALRNAAGGLTDEQGIDATGLSPSTYRPRRIELVQLGFVEKSGRTELTRAARKADVYVVTGKGRAE